MCSRVIRRLRSVAAGVFQNTAEIRRAQRGESAVKADRDRSGHSRYGGEGAAEYSDDLRTARVVRTDTPGPVPEGRRRRLAGGKSAPADAAPGYRAASLRAPTGHRRKWPEATAGRGNAAVQATPKTSSMPRWGMDRSAAQPGAAPAERACPRLISCGVPPGRRATRRRQFRGWRTAARAEQNPRGVQGFCRVVVQRGEALVLSLPGSAAAGANQKQKARDHSRAGWFDGGKRSVTISPACRCCRCRPRASRWFPWRLCAWLRRRRCCSRPRRWPAWPSFRDRRTRRIPASRL